ncbi:gluconate kinase, partial [Lactobacillus sp. XV13L]|nr:gluconate kinase [Lactobacillus sp. XV13L]
MQYLIGIDVGTTNTKAILYNLAGSALAKASQSYLLYQEEPEMAEEDPEEIFQATLRVIKTVILRAQVSGQDVVALCWSAQQHSLLALDYNYQPLSRVITWADNRAASLVQQLQKKGQALKIYQRTGLPIHPMGPIYKLLWLQQSQPHIFQQAAYWVGIKEYLIWRYTGQLQEEQSMAASTGLMDLKSLSWCPQLLDLAGITTAQLPPLVPITAQIKGIKNKYADLTGLNSQVITVMGATDGALSTLGLSGNQADTLTINIGTSAAVRTVTSQPKLDQQARLFCYPINQSHYLVGGPLNNGGIVFNWAKDALFGEQQTTASLLKTNDYELLNQIAATSPAGAHGLLFHPYLGGERAPLWDANARGSFYGLNRNHTRADMLRAVMEGIVFNIYDVATS